MSQLYLILAVLLPAIGMAQSFQLVSNSTDPSVQSIIKETQQLLPDTLKRNVARNIHIRFTKLDSLDRIYLPCEKVFQNKGTHRLAEVDSFFTKLNPINEIRVNHNFLKLLKSQSSATCGTHHREYLIRTILHEVAHIFDFNDHLDAEEAQAYYTHCSQPNDNPSRAAFCGTLIRKGKYSESLEFMSLDNWKNPSTSKNVDLNRSQDPYERTHVWESFAVHFENFILDPQFSCRKPALYKFFQKLFGDSPRAKECSTPNTLVFSQNRPFQLDSKRLYEAHYLLADKGEDISSRWGHSMLRLVFCAPTRRQVDEKCLEDVSEHVVVSFRAHVDGMGVDNLKGLTGKYPSRLYLIPLNQIVTEYTQSELRNLRSVPLNLNASEKETLLMKIMETYWSYRGKYYFVSNNCATETAFLLASVLPKHRISFQQYFSQIAAVTPIGLMDFLNKMKITNSVTDSEKIQIQKGYLFKSNRPTLQLAYRALTKNSNSLYNTVTFEDYVSQSKAIERRELFLKSLELQTGPKNLLASAAYLLEMHIISKQISIIRQKFFEKSNDDSTFLKRLSDAFNDNVEEILVTQNFGYGIPLKNELDTYLNRLDVKNSDPLKKLEKETQSLATQLFPALMKELKETNDNNHLFLKQITTH